MARNSHLQRHSPWHSKPGRMREIARCRRAGRNGSAPALPSFFNRRAEAGSQTTDTEHNC